MEAADAEFLVANIKKGNRDSANKMLKSCLEGSKEGFDPIFRNLSDTEAHLVRNYLSETDTIDFLEAVIKKRIRQIDNYFTAVDQGLWP